MARPDLILVNTGCRYGVGAEIVNTAEATALSVNPVAVVIALIVVVLATEIGDVYAGLESVGVLPSTVNRMTAPGVALASATLCGDMKGPAAGEKVGVAACVGFGVGIGAGELEVTAFWSDVLFAVILLTRS